MFLNIAIIEKKEKGQFGDTHFITCAPRKEEQKEYQRYSGWRGGLKTFNAKTMLEQHPDRVIMEAVWGMLPKNTISRKMMTRVKVYRGAEHPHAAQAPAVAAF